LLSCNFEFSSVQTEVTTVICGNKELKKLVEVSGQLDTVKRVICMDDDIPSSASLVAQSGRWRVVSMADVEKLGRENPVDDVLPLAADVAVIMYTSGSTGLPKVRSICYMICIFRFLFILFNFTVLHLSWFLIGWLLRSNLDLYVMFELIM
jgi:hypothetical protein